MNKVNFNVDSLFLRLIPEKEATELAEEYPFDHFLDLAVGYRWLGKTDEGVRYSVPVKFSDLKECGLEREYLYKLANENTKRLFKSRLYKMEDIVFQLMENKKAKNIEDDGCVLPKDEIYVLSNESGTFGASVMMDEDLLKNVGDRLDCDYFILPSSIHEVILMPTSLKAKPDELRNIVENVNSTAVSACDYLSDSVYYYDRLKEEVLCVA